MLQFLQEQKEALQTARTIKSIIEESANDKIVEDLIRKHSKTATLLPYQNIFLEKKRAYQCYLLAVHVSGADIKVIQQIVIGSSNARICYLLARDVKGVDVPLLEQVIIKNKAISICVDFASNISGANIENLQEVIMKTKNLELLLDFFRRVEGANPKQLEKQLIKDKNLWACYKLAQIPAANKRGLQRIILNDSDPYYSLLFARDVEDANIAALQEVVEKSKNIDCCTKFLQNIEAADKVSLIKVLQLLENAKKIEPYPSVGAR